MCTIRADLGDRLIGQRTPRSCVPSRRSTNCQAARCAVHSATRVRIATHPSASCHIGCARPVTTPFDFRRDLPTPEAGSSTPRQTAQDRTRRQVAWDCPGRRPRAILRGRYRSSATRAGVAPIGDISGWAAATARGSSSYNIGRIAPLVAGIDHHVPEKVCQPASCASSLQTACAWPFTRSRPARAHTYIAAGVEAVLAHQAARQFEFNHRRRRFRGLRLQRLHPHGHDGRERRRAPQRRQQAQDEWALVSRPAARGCAAESGTSTPRSCP